MMEDQDIANRLKLKMLFEKEQYSGSGALSPSKSFDENTEEVTTTPFNLGNNTTYSKFKIQEDIVGE